MQGTSKSFRLIAIIALLTIYFSVFTASALASTKTAQTKTPSWSAYLIKQSPATINAYWTPERMKSARPVEELVAKSKLTHTTATQGKAQVGQSTLAKNQVSAKVIRPAASSLPQGSYSQFPYSTIGKIFFTDSNTGYNYVCSGASVSSSNGNVVDTAGHCVVEGGSGGNWYTNWQFCPQYYYGSTPYGCWTARAAYAASDWVDSGSFEDDFGDVAVNANGYGNLNDVVGGAGWTYNQSSSQYYYAYGYPAAAPFNGKEIDYCASSSTAYSMDDGTVLSITCNMTGGSSGGPWFISVGGTFGYVNGHNDFKYNNDSNHMYSPYYDGDWYAVFDAAQNA